MPYIAINTTQELSSAQKEKIKGELGRLITLIPTKTEAGLMVDFCGSKTIYKAGKEADCAFIELRLFHKADFELKKKFVEETFGLFSRELGLGKENMCFNILELDNWGSDGQFKT